MMTEPVDYKLSPYEREVIVCAGCLMADKLYKDAHGIFCHRCGPSVPVTTRELGTAFVRALASQGKQP